jgi:hypothetical protein
MHIVKRQTITLMQNVWDMYNSEGHHSLVIATRNRLMYKNVLIKPTKITRTRDQVHLTYLEYERIPFEGMINGSNFSWELSNGRRQIGIRRSGDTITISCQRFYHEKWTLESRCELNVEEIRALSECKHEILRRSSLPPSIIHEESHTESCFSNYIYEEIPDTHDD